MDDFGQILLHIRSMMSRCGADGVRAFLLNLPFGQDRGILVFTGPMIWIESACEVCRLAGLTPTGISTRAGDVWIEFARTSMFAGCHRPV